MTVDEVLNRSMPEPTTGCWLWLGGVTGEGYGSLNGKLAHRLSYEAAFGPIPIGMLVRHRCDQPMCVNPDHLLIGTHVENMADKVRRGRAAGAGKGERHWKAALTPNAVLAIRADQRSQTVIAKAYGIRQSTVSKIKLKQTWAHI